MIKTKEQDVNITPTEKWNYCASVTLQKLLRAHDPLLLWHMEKKLVMNVIKNKIIYQFQFGYTSYPGLNHNRTIKYKVERSTRSTFEKKQCLSLKKC